MRSGGRSGLFLGTLLLLVGGLLLAFQFVPGLAIWIGLLHWSIYFMGAGVLICFLALLMRAPRLLIPGFVTISVGAIFAWKSPTGMWASWIYTWPLTLTAMGVGMVFAAILGPEEERRHQMIHGFQLCVVSLAGFFILDAWLGMGLLGPYWPLAFVGVGLWLVVRNLFL